MAEFSDRLNEAMLMRDMSAAELARLSGVNEGSISQYRKNKYKASQRQLEKLANTLRVSVAWLMGCDVPIEDHSQKQPETATENTTFTMDLTPEERAVILTCREKPDILKKICALFGIFPENFMEGTYKRFGADFHHEAAYGKIASTYFVPYNKKPDNNK